MKYTILLFLLLVLVSCGKSSSGGSSPQNQQQGDYIEVSETVGPSDLLNVILSTPATITSDQILFGSTKTVTDRGERKTCVLSVDQSRPWSYSLDSGGLTILAADGTSFRMRAAVGSNQGINGSWIWKGRENDMRIIRRFSFLPHRVIFNQDCES